MLKQRKCAHLLYKKYQTVQTHVENAQAFMNVWALWLHNNPSNPRKSLHVCHNVCVLKQGEPPHATLKASVTRAYITSIESFHSLKAEMDWISYISSFTRAALRPPQPKEITLNMFGVVLSRGQKRKRRSPTYPTGRAPTFNFHWPIYF